MQSGPITRNVKKQREYLNHAKNRETGCSFCKFDMSDQQVLEEHDYFWVVENIFGYTMWDSCGVDSHLMIVPKRHLTSISEYNQKEAKEFVAILGEYEQKSFSSYSRSPDNITKSVLHQHTHLIKLDGKRKKWLVFIRKPHILLHK